MLQRKRNAPSRKRDLPAQQVTVRLTLSNGSGTHRHLFLSIQLPIDHFGDYEGTFQNRYWYNATYYQQGGPVFRMRFSIYISNHLSPQPCAVFDVGETNAEPYASELVVSSSR